MRKDIIELLRGRDLVTVDFDEIEYWMDLGHDGMNRVLGSADGLAGGTIMEIYGKEGSGKSTLAYHLLACAQMMGNPGEEAITALVDTEGRFSKDFFTLVGGEPDKLELIELGEKEIKAGKKKITIPESMEDVFDKIQGICMTIIEEDYVEKGPHIIAWDSIAATPTTDELLADSEDKLIASQARVMAIGLRKVHKALRRANVILIMLNQARDDIGGGVFSAMKTPGGRAPKHYARIRVQTSRVSGPTKKNRKIKFKIRNKKNTLGTPMLDADYVLDLGKGIEYK